MRSDQARPVRLSDYRPPDFAIPYVELTVKLAPNRTQVIAAISFEPHPKGTAGAPLVLDGDGLTLVSLALNGAPLAPDAYVATPDSLTIAAPPPGAFSLTIETLLEPEANTQLMGLYRSSGTWCTQCEAEGFRRITYFLDRPDVLSVYRTRIEADRTLAPILLGNG
ncbi:MAG: aminopeptidase N, partial [Alphaproteobacteria bacterium]